MDRVASVSPASSPRWALTGRLVTMDARSTVVEQGTVWIKDAAIAAITSEGDAAPQGFDGVTPVDTGGTVFPGLIELHNHLAYDVLPLWAVPSRFGNRDVWGNSSEYHRRVTAPMQTIGEATELLPSLVRYVEVKALVGGVTTTQGLPLFSAPGLVRYYKGIVRNVEQPGDVSLPAAAARIADVDARDAQKFLAELGKHKCVLLHLSEGTDAAAYQHFQALKLPGDGWAITSALAGIHCVALKAADFQTLADAGASMVWSPLSNLLLYGQTADVAAAKAAGPAATPLKIGLGSDWSPTGSRSLFGELKVARVHSQNHGTVFSDGELVALATVDGARILGWQDQLGTIEIGKRADLTVVAGKSDPPYARIFAGDERQVQLVVIDGTARYGTTELLADGPDLEPLQVGGEPRALYLKQDQEDPDVAAVSYAQAKSALEDALQNIKQIRLEQEARQKAPPAARAGLERPGPRLALDEFEPTNFTQRPHLPLGGVATGPTATGLTATGLTARATAAAAPISSLLEPIALDPLTVADDPGYLERVTAEQNLPAWLAPGLKSQYQQV